MADEQSAHIVINFTTVSASDEEEIKVELDDDQNGDRTSFSPGEHIFVRVHRNPANSYQVFTNGGTAVKVGTDVNLNITEEELVFTQSQENNLDYFPRTGSVVAFTAACGSPPTPAVEGKRVSFASEQTAVLNAAYETLFDRWRLVYPCATGPALFVAVMDEEKSSLNISIEEAAGPTDYTLVVRDYCTDAIIPGATVFLDMVNIGDTDSSGRIDLGTLTPGQTYQLKITKTGYLDSDVDVIRNDEFTVPTS